MARLPAEIRKAIVGCNPLVYLHTSEEDRVSGVLSELASNDGGTAWPIYMWSCVSGFSGFAEELDTRDPVEALRAILNSGDRGFFVMRDLASFMDDPAVARALREIYYTYRGRSDRFVFILSPELVVPEGLKKEMHMVDVLPPDEHEIRAQVEEVRKAYPNSGLSDDHIPEMVLALKGMTISEIDHVLRRVFDADHPDKDSALLEIFSEKEMVVKKSGFLEFCPPRTSIDGIGGLEVLKDWLRNRKALFSQEALDAGVPMPKGLLIMGVSGCGKSLAVKVISSLWSVPLFRLDMNLVFSGMYGTPESAFHRALKTIETVAPAILWIDEIENSLGLTEDKIEMDSHIFSSFLTWMQEKPPLIFIAATANRIHALPAEIIRKGRFDQVFFVDLPDEAERKEILKIHLRGNGAEPEVFDLKMLGIETEGWSGAEIEQAIIAARVDAYADGREFGMKDVNNSVAKIVPLSKTMEDQIKSIRDWAFDRATNASKRTRRMRY